MRLKSFHSIGFIVNFLFSKKRFVASEFSLFSGLILAIFWYRPCSLFSPVLP
jgi:hypothetical protein